MKKILGLLMVVGLLVSFGGCGDKDSPTGPSEEITEGPQGQTLEVSEQEIKIYTDKQGREVTKEEYDKMLSFVKGEIKVFKNVEYQFYRNGNEEVKHGYYKEYYENGKIESEGLYITTSGIDSGLPCLFSCKGAVDAGYTNKLGRWVYYYENGQVKSEGNYAGGEKDGKWVWYDEEGNITDEYCYEIKWFVGIEVDCP